MERRRLLKVLLTSGGALAAAIVGVPALVLALSPVLRRPPGEVWRPVGSLDQFPLDEVRAAVVEIPRADWARTPDVKAVYVWRTGPGEAVVFSRNCTDLSCPVNWDPGSQCFYCPCHGGIFLKNGDRIAGPPPRPLYRYATRVRAGSLEIDLHSLPPMT
jgi:menaquinol-cytochrome c reductase iron-sulfur subunit